MTAHVLEGWRSTCLSDVVSLQRGHDLTWRQRRQGTVPVMGSAGANGTHDRAIAPGPGVVLGRSGASFGEAHYIDRDYWPHNTALYVTDFHGNEPRFVYYLLSSIDFTRHNSGGAQQSLNRNFIASITLKIPGREEQQCIVAALDDVSYQITAVERLIVKKQAIKQGMLQQLLTGRTRLPGFTGQWSEGTLGSIATVNMGQSPNGTSYNTVRRGMPLVQGNADIKDRRTIDRLWTTQPTKRCRAGDVVLTVRAPVGYTAIASRDVCLGRGVCSVATGTDNRFLFHALVYAEPRWVVFEQGSTFAAVNSAEVRSFTITWPSDSRERGAIASTLDDVDDEITTLHTRLAKAQDVKRGMMQELLTGRTRLPAQEVAS